MRLLRPVVVPVMFLTLGSGVMAQAVNESPPPGGAVQKQRPTRQQQAAGAAMLRTRGDDDEVSQSRAPEELKLFQLEQIEASSAHDVVSKLLGMSVRIAVDSRSNSLIANGTSEELAKVEAVLLRLEETAPRQTHWQVYKPKYLNVSAIGNSMKKMFPNVLTQEDSRSGKLLFEADDQQAKNIVAALNELDTELKTLPPSKPDPPPAPDWQLRVVWMVEKDAPQQVEDAIPTDLKAPIQKLKEKTGIKEVKSVAQFLVNINGQDPEFKTFGSATIESNDANDQVQVACDGAVYYDEYNENPKLDFTATVSPVGEDNDKKKLASINAIVAIKPKRPVIIGMNSINGKASIVVVEMIPADEEK